MKSYDTHSQRIGAIKTVERQCVHVSKYAIQCAGGSDEIYELKTKNALYFDVMSMHFFSQYERFNLINGSKLRMGVALWLFQTHIINESGSYAVFIYETHLALQPFLINVSLIELKSKIIRTV